MTCFGKLVDNKIIIESDFEELYNQKFYGRLKNGSLELNLIEAAYLIYTGKLKINSLNFKDFFLKAVNLNKNFELYYIVYKDLRERGYYVQSSVTGFRVYPRGGAPRKTPAKYYVMVISERKPLSYFELMKLMDTTENLKKRLILGIVDEESDITYYEAKKTKICGTYFPKFKKSIISADFLDDRVMIWDKNISNLLFNNGFFGKLIDNRYLQLSLIESFYLMKNKVINIEKNDEIIDTEDFLKIASKIEPSFIMKYRIYENLRKNGIVPKTGFKFGTDFRIYKNFKDIASLTHSDELVHVIDKNHVFLLQDMSRGVRLANSVRKSMVYGVDDDNIKFFIIERIKL